MKNHTLNWSLFHRSRGSSYYFFLIIRKFKDYWKGKDNSESLHPPSPLTVNIVNGTQIKNISDITSLFYVLLSLNYKLLLFLYFLVKIVVALLCGFMYTLFNNLYFLCRFTRNSCHLVIHKPRGHFLGIFDTPSLWGHFYKLRLM